MRSKGVGGRSGFFMRSQLAKVGDWLFGDDTASGSTEAAQEPFDTFGPLGDLHRAMQAPSRPNPQGPHDCARILIAEADATKSAAAFDEGHYMQIEVAGKLASSKQQALADQFLAYLTSDAAQAVIPTTNWMYPAKTPAAGLPAGFETLITPAKSLLLTPVEAEAGRKAAVEEWQTVLSQ